MSEFYVGYLPKAPEQLGRFMLRVILGLGAVAVLAALLLVSAQQPLADSAFEYGVEREYRGRIIERPYPQLLTPGATFLLVAPGKRGASDLVRGFDAREVHLTGSLIHRGGDRMLQLAPDSLRAVGPATPGSSLEVLGDMTLWGEIVDSKCYFGVMNPGSGKVHRDCAVRCISGGIPPALIVRDRNGATRTLLLAGVDGRALGKELLTFVAEPIEIPGKLVRSGGVWIYRIDPRSIRRYTRGGNNGSTLRH